MERSSAQELAVVVYEKLTKPQLNVEIAALTKRLSQLEKLVRKSSQNRSRSHSNQKERYRKRSHSQGKPQDKSTGVRYFHNKFGNNAWKCRKPYT